MRPLLVAECQQLHSHSFSIFFLHELRTRFHWLASLQYYLWVLTRARLLAYRFITSFD